MTDIVIGSWRLKQVPWPSWVVTRTVPPTDWTMLWTTSSPTPRPERLVTSVAGGEAGEEQEFEQFGLGELGGHGGGGHLAVDDAWRGPFRRRCRGRRR